MSNWIAYHPALGGVRKRGTLPIATDESAMIDAPQRRSTDMEASPDRLALMAMRARVEQLEGRLLTAEAALGAAMDIARLIREDS